MSLTNHRLRVTATLRWDRTQFPHASYWCEANASAGFPWHQRAYVLAIEPAASIPGNGIDAATSLVEFAPGQTRRVTLSLTVRQSATART